MQTLSQLRAAAAPAAPFPQQAAWGRRLHKLLPLPELKPLRVAVLGNGTLSHFAETLRFWLAMEGFHAEIYLAPYGAYRQEILDHNSGLDAFRPDVVWLFATARDANLEHVRHGASLQDCQAAIAACVAEWRTLWDQLRRNLRAVFIQNNFEAPAIRVFGHYDGAISWSRSNLIRRLNLALAKACGDENVCLFDLDHAASRFGLNRWHEERHWYQSKQPFAPDAFGMVAFEAARLIATLKGGARKCVVVDLDNTLWGGTIGDDGLANIRLGDGADGEAFVAFQDHLKMLLSRRSKVENLQEIASTLNIGTDALVFVDDNPAERELVRSLLPEVAVPELSDDPAEYVAGLASGRYFEAVSFSQEDASRTRLYYENAQREAARSAATDLTAFLQALQMEADSGPADSFTLPRMAQLLARTNQFHPTTTRHGESELSAFAADPQAWVRWFSLRDRFGDHGLASVVVLLPRTDALVIDSWAMSCRVFSRGLEEFVFLEMLEAVRTRGTRLLIGRYLPTRKNRPVADLYQRLGFTPDGTEEDGASRWVLDVSAPAPAFSSFIRPRRTCVAV
jgi:FkbH-like protein